MTLDHILRWQAADRYDARRLGLSTTAYHLLCLIARADGRKISDYARTLGQPVHVTNQHLDSLIKWGWARKSRKPSDRRAWSLHLTPEGSKALAGLHKKTDPTPQPA